MSIATSIRLFAALALATSLFATSGCAPADEPLSQDQLDGIDVPDGDGKTDSPNSATQVTFGRNGVGLVFEAGVRGFFSTAIPIDEFTTLNLCARWDDDTISSSADVYFRITGPKGTKSHTQLTAEHSDACFAFTTTAGGTYRVLITTPENLAAIATEDPPVTTRDLIVHDEVGVDSSVAPPVFKL